MFLSNLLAKTMQYFLAYLPNILIEIGEPENFRIDVLLGVKMREIK